MSESPTPAIHRRRLHRAGGVRFGQWVVPAFLVIWVALVIVPLVVLFVFSFFETKSFATIYRPSLATWQSLFESGRFEVTIRTLRIALTVTVIVFLIGFPFALWLAKGTSNRTVKALVLALLTIPFFLDISSRTIIWRAILGENGLINTVLQSLHVIDHPLSWMLYTEGAAEFGMIIGSFPMMVLPIYMALDILDDTLVQASGDLGASPLQTLVHVVMPLSLPGIMAGVVLTLGATMAAWVEPSMLGGGFVNLLSNSVESAYTALRYPVVAALSTFVIVLLALLLGILWFLARRIGDPASTFRVLRA